MGPDLQQCAVMVILVLRHWEIRLPAPYPGIPLSYIILTLSQPVPALS